MESAVIHNFGGTDQFVLEEKPHPTPSQGEVLVEVYAAGVNPIDLKTRIGQGVSRLWNTTNFPIVLGWDISGVVVDSKDPKFKVGDEVFGMPHFPSLAGAYAEFIAAPANELTTKPYNISHVEAAASPLAALTAWQGLFDTAKLQAGQTVLIHAGAGGVGHLAIQLARWKGASVTSTTSKPNISFVTSLGAEMVIDYTSTNYWEVLTDIDIVFHMISPDLLDKSYQTMKSGGHLISITGPVSPEEPAAYNVTGQFLSVRPNGIQMAQIADLLGTGIIKVEIDASYPLKDVAKAHKHVEGGHTVGKVVINLK